MRAVCRRIGLLWVPLYLAIAANGQTKQSTEQILEAGRAALRQQHYVEAIHLLEDGTKQYPADQDLKLELGRAYLYDRRDAQAIHLFQEVLREDPSNRMAKLELARAAGYHRDYETSDRVYRELLTSHPEDEAASIGLVRNLIHEKRMEEARRACALALTHHPESKRLQQYRQQLNNEAANKPASEPQSGEPNPAAQTRRAQVQGSSAYFSDSAGNCSWRSTQQFEHQIIGGLSTRLRIEERSLWLTGGPKASVLWGTDEMRMRLTHSLALGGTGGAVRFADGSTRPLYRGELELHPLKRLWITSGFGRRPISPTYDSAQFDLLAQGWHTRLEWYPRAWWFNASWSREHYSDSNRNQRMETELLRWIGSSRFSVGAGYRFNYLAFDQSLLHGYFNPSDYRSHLARTGLRFRVGKVFHAEYVGGAGAESISGGPYQSAWELAFRNRVKLENWELSGDYFYFHLAQNTGAFRSQAGRLAVAYLF
ncbi:MAG TPA: tetratricopeptide repeat protein [Candidatus Acidoferrum sp.]|nr:tetratricopeptide repeat protein [Candidatus Acidoferrum sp.]